MGFCLYCVLFSTLFGFFYLFISEDTMTSPYSLYEARRRVLQGVSGGKGSDWSSHSRLGLKNIACLLYFI